MSAESWTRIQEALAKESMRMDSEKGTGQGQYVHNNFFASFGTVATAWREISKETAST